MATRAFGQRIKRNEDDRLLRGKGRYLDDVELPGALHVAFLRSWDAHARITRLDLSRAHEHPGVVGVYGHEDLGEHDVVLPLMIPHPSMEHPHTQFLLAHDEVFYVGQTIAMVVAESRYVAEDALELIEIEYESLPVIVDVDEAVKEGSPLVHEDAPGNVAAHLVQIVGDPDEAFTRADLIFKERYVLERSAGMSMETRGVAAVYEARSR